MDGTADTTQTNTPAPAPAQPSSDQMDGWKQAASPTPTPATPAPAPAAPGTPAAPAAPAPQKPVVLTPARTGILGAVDKIADALAGKNRPEVAHDQDGNAYVKETTLSRGQQWARIGGEVVAGAAAGLAGGRGGNIGGAAEAGVKAGQQAQQQQKQNAKDVTAQVRQEKLDNANNQMLRMQMAEQTWRLSRMQTEATQKDVEFSQGQVDRFTKEGGQVLGTAAHPYDIGGILKVNPDVMKDLIQKHQIEITPNYDENGKRAGVTIIKMPTGYRSTMLPAGATFHTFDSTTGQLVEHKASDPMTAGERDDYDFAASSTKMKFEGDKAEQALKQAQAAKAQSEAANAPLDAALKKSEVSKNYAEAHHAETESKVLNEANDAGTIQSNAQQLYEGSMDPANLSRRSKTYDATLAAANAISMQQTGKPFDIAKAMGDYKFATNPQTYNTLNYLNSLVGRDNKGGNLSVAQQLGQKVGNGNYPPLNNVEQWAKISAGNTDVAAYRAALLEVDDQIAKILQGGGTGSGTTDAKMKQAAEVLDKNFSPAQFNATVNNALRPLLANRKTEMIGDNRYLQMWHGQQQQQAPQASQRPPKPQSVPDGYLFVKTTPQDPGQWIDPQKLTQAKTMAPQLTVVQ